MPYSGTTSRARRYVSGLGQIDPLSAIIGGATGIGTQVYGFVEMRRQEREAARREKKAEKALAAAQAKKEAAELRAEQDAQARATAAALHQERLAAQEAGASAARTAQIAGTVAGLAGPGLVLGIIALGLWFAFRRRG